MPVEPLSTLQKLFSESGMGAWLECRPLVRISIRVFFIFTLFYTDECNWIKKRSDAPTTWRASWIRRWLICRRTDTFTEGISLISGRTDGHSLLHTVYCSTHSTSRLGSAPLRTVVRAYNTAETRSSLGGFIGALLLEQNEIAKEARFKLREESVNLIE